MPFGFVNLPFLHNNKSEKKQAAASGFMGLSGAYMKKKGEKKAGKKKKK